MTTPLPEWIDREAWDGFVEMRKRQEKLSRGKIVWTARAEKLILRDLYAAKAAGHDANQLLDQSVREGWRGVFQGKDAPKSFRERDGEQIASSLSKLTGGLLGRRPSSPPSQGDTLDMEPPQHERIARD
jgi:hypothetical protein